MFPAFLEGISDNYNSDYQTINYMGRPEPFYKYSGFKRDIGFGFTVVAQSKAEISTMYEKLNFLASTIAPSYTSAGYMTGNIAYLTIGDLYVNQPGIIGGFSFNVPEAVTWDIGLYEDKDGVTQGDGAQVPMMIKVNGFKFTPLYNDIPSWGSSIWFGSNKVINTTELLPTSEAFVSEETTSFREGQANINKKAENRKNVSVIEEEKGQINNLKRNSNSPFGSDAGKEMDRRLTREGAFQINH